MEESLIRTIEQSITVAPCISGIKDDKDLLT